VTKWGIIVTTDGPAGFPDRLHRSENGADGNTWNVLPEESGGPGPLSGPPPATASAGLPAGGDSPIRLPEDGRLVGQVRGQQVRSEHDGQRMVWSFRVERYDPATGDRVLLVPV